VIDWRGVLVNALWVLGSGFLLAGLSIKSYVALSVPTTRALQGQRCAHISLKRSAPILLRVGLILFCGGLLGLSATTWERVIWTLALALMLKSLVQHLRGTALTSGPSSNLVQEE
jgi:hypothetical protein